jgi:hypothetical protein
MEDKLVTIAEYMDSLKADMAKQVLEDFGIQAIIVGRNAADVFGGVTAYFTAIKLQVKQSDADKARQILESQEPSYTPEELEDLDDLDEPGGPEEPQEQ